MTRIRVVVLTTAAVLAVAFVTVALAAPAPLTGTVGPGFTISMKKPTKAGTYKLTVTDKSDIHNFHITGPGVNKKTSVGKTGKTIFTVALKKGTYRFICDPHADSMKGSFTIR